MAENMHQITDRERRLCALLLNNMAFEFAKTHCNLPYPDVDQRLLQQILEIGPPNQYDLGSGEYGQPQAFRRANTAAQCFAHFNQLRHNLIHANKSKHPDTIERLEELLDWSEAFAAHVYGLEVDFAVAANYAKRLLGIENF